MGNKQEQIVYNAIRTPDGTLLVSRHRHDYLTYKDQNGLTYMVDGGFAYLRRNHHPEGPHAEELSVFIGDGFDKVRESFEWGAQRETGLTYIKLCDLETDHIKAILASQSLSDWMYGVFCMEIAHRQGYL